MANKLELTWVGKEDKIEIEPRILIEKPELGYSYSQAKKDGKISIDKVSNADGINDNMLIHGDNLLALKALEQEYAGKVKCIYIDPPYNINAANEHYDDFTENSKWLTLMKKRLEILNVLLASNGVIIVQIDKEQNAYLKILMDEVFGRMSYITTVAVRMSATSGFKIEHADKTIVKNTEYLHIYSRCLNLCSLAYEKTDYDSHYNYILKNQANDLYSLANILDEEIVVSELKKYNLKRNSQSLSILYKFSEVFKEFVKINKSIIGRTHTAPAGVKNEELFLKSKLISKNLVIKRIYNGENYFIKATDNGFNQFIPISLKFNKLDDVNFFGEEHSNILGDWWDGFYLDMGNIDNEGDVYFKNSKKPERLIFRIIRMFSNPGDLVLDSFLGSGTTAAVAHKMGRRWIGIEMGEHAYTHCKVRLDKVVSGEDQGGISKAQNWKGGGGYKFYELAPSLILKDKYGREIINPDYNADMLASAMAKQEGCVYCPSAECYWKQAKSTENAYLYTTTQHLTREYLDEIAGELKEDEHLIIACKSFESSLEHAYKNITIKKIPNILLDRCEFGKSDYKLNVVDMPVLDAEEDNE